jgi:Tol biopolymer transport system component
VGQTPPGEEPALFAPGIVNTGLYTRDFAMMPDGSEIYYGVNVGNYALTAILVTHELGGRWTQPEVAPFSGDPRWSDIEPCISPDGKMMYFASTRPVGGEDTARENHSIWAMKREREGWGDPYRLPEAINDGSSNFYPSVTEDGTLYFTRDLPDGGNAIFRSRLVGDDYGEPERLPAQVNATRNQFNAFVAPDESYVIVPIFGMPDSLGSTDYYITFRSDDDTWSEPINLGEKVNTEGGLEYAPYVSRDGKYFFFMSARNDAVKIAGDRLSAAKLQELHNTPGTGLPGIWWVAASFLSDLRP